MPFDTNSSPDGARAKANPLATGTSFDLAEAFKDAGPGEIARALGTLPYYSRNYPDGYFPPDVPEGYRPGERILRGRAEVFADDLLIAYQSDRRLSATPKDLTSLSYEALGWFWSDWLNRDSRTPHDPIIKALGERICVEMARRPEHIAAYGPAASAA